MTEKGKHFSPETEFKKGHGKKEPVAIKCKHCGKDFLVLPHEVKERIYCSNSCSAKKTANRRGRLFSDDKKYWTTKREKVLFGKWDNATKEEILSLFQSKSWTAIRNQIQYMRVRKGYKIPVRPRNNSAIFSWTHEKEICMLYTNENKSSHELAKMFNTNHGFILRILKKNGVVMRSNSIAHKLAMTNERRKKHSEKMKNLFKEQPQRKMLSARSLIAFHKRNPKFRSESQRRWLGKPENYKSFCELMKKVQSTPESRRGKSERRALQKFPLWDATTTEIPLQQELKRRGIPFKKSYPIFDKNKKPVRLVDIAFPEAKLAVEADGDYWHGNPKKFTELNNMQQERQQKDQAQDVRICAVGWRLLRLWESDIQANLSKCVDKIEQMLKTKDA